MLFLSANHSEKLTNTVNIFDPDFHFMSPLHIGVPSEKMNYPPQLHVPAETVENVNIRGIKYLGYHYFKKGKLISKDLPF
jgi:hypothetical protein